ncbi:MAG: LLM class F420-dependent oxidoreductase [Microbacterium sp. 71-36]|uniref:LLM class F420-dependent oxidoreductase n=1 Tax=unclassified Microbacterium TaxID=2609290 RepID=UPI00086BC618|nr:MULTISPECIES: LLM class F420-dependent oxidoreductase [unclassified Microbacterium]MBN9212080.1 LLM class F420-dependent oxidoreductase [Microbacterium sp.]ODT39891.1 MAG: LLM class F420-dependent oxidoreductase [Microbacterium sp. SCN 71-17]ODU52554.1 MAG: LLM class F420-dependent oxidoreductase [Microbacterium sp. SCN 70-10]OJV77948.1 MAG: LLM class F420-dependent oxidoreductase [Microbacterium sp. 71-36]
MEYCLFTEPQQGFTYDDQLAFARSAEAHGLDGFFRSDHYLRMGDGDPLPGPTDAWTTLAGLARETSRIRLGTLVSSVTYRVPGILAIQVAQVDAMSGGRAELGLGTGWFEAEHAAYGIPFPPKRFDLLEEQLAIVTGLWSTPVGETFSFEGANYRLDAAPALPKPVQSPLPVIVGGGGPKRTPALAARFATEFNIGFVPEDVVAEKFAVVRAACEDIGRDPATLKLSVALPTIVGADDAAIERRAAAIGQTRAQFDNGANLIGRPEEIAAKVERLRDLGAERVYFQLLDLRDIDHADEVGAELLPLLPR